MRKLSEDDVMSACTGGSVFASGGGAFYEHGLDMGYAALKIGDVVLAGVDELPPDGIVLTQTAIGAPGGTTDWQMQGRDYIRAVQLVKERYESKNPGRRVVGLMTPQNGKSSSTNGWVSAAALDLYMVDATGDLRAHPTGEMGDMGVNSDRDYVTIQAAVGGRKEYGQHLEVIAEGASKTTSKILRTASDQGGGFIATARHPLTVDYIAHNAVVGGLSQAIELGRLITSKKNLGPNAVIDAVLEQTHGEILARGRIADKKMTYTNQAFDIGEIIIKADDGGGMPIGSSTGDGEILTIHAQNEFMAIDSNTRGRVSTYPDIQVVFDAVSAYPLSTNDIFPGQNVVVFRISKDNIRLSSGVKDPDVYPDVEKALGIDLFKYSFPKEAAELAANPQIHGLMA